MLLLLRRSRPLIVRKYHAFHSATVVNHRFMSSSSHQASSSAADVVGNDATLVETAQEVAMKIGDLKAAGLCNWTPPGMIESLLEFVQVNSGLPWWITIVATAFSVRALISPLQINSLRSAAVLARIQPELKGLMAEYEKVKRVKDHEQMAVMQQQIQAVYHKNGISMFSAFKGVFLSAPITLSFFMALRDITDLNLPSLKTGGMLWFSDLTVPDPYFALPLMAAGSFLYVVEKGMEMPNTASNQTDSQKQMNKNMFRIMAIGSIPLMATYPAALSMYWVTNSIFTIGFTTAMRNPYIVEKLKLDGSSLKPIEKHETIIVAGKTIAIGEMPAELTESPQPPIEITREQVAKALFNDVDAEPKRQRHLHLKKQQAKF